MAEETKGETAKSTGTGAPTGAPAPAAWALPLKNLDARLTTIESKLLFVVILAEVGALALWVFLKGLSIAGTDPRSGIIRAAVVGGLGAAIAGIATRKLDAKDPKKSYIPMGALAAGIVVGYVTRNSGGPYFENWLNWLQNASVLMLVGGIRGLVTRLTLWVSLLGASIATGKGKNINIDVVMRFAPVGLRIPIAVIGWSAAALMCVTASWGFIEHLAIAEYHADATVPCEQNKKNGCDTTPGSKVEKIREGFGLDMFLVRKQLAYDMSSLPKVIGGTKYDQWLSPAEWNERIKNGGWESHFEKEKVDTVLAPPERTDPKLPAVVIPGGSENAGGILVRDLSLVIPMGLFIIALRFIVRTILALTGHVIVDPDAAHAEDDDDKPHDPPTKTTTEAEVAS